MNVEETVTATAVGGTSISATITAAAETLLVCFAASNVYDKPGSFTGPTGWTSAVAQTDVLASALGTRQYLLTGVWWKYNEAAGDVAAQVDWVKPSGGPDEVTNSGIVLFEISGASKLDSNDIIAALAEDYAPAVAGDLVIAVSREANIGLLLIALANTQDTATTPTGYTNAVNVDVATSWSLCTYWKVLPYSTTQQVQPAPLSETSAFIAAFIEADITIGSGQFFGEF